MDAIVGAGDATRSAARQAVVERLDEPAAVDSAAIVANFEMMTRIADGTGARHETIDVEIARATGADQFDSVR